MRKTAKGHRQPAGIAVLAVVVAIFTGCAGTPPMDSYRAQAGANIPAGGERLQLIDAARRAIGTPYRYGGSSPAGFDCSGLVQFTHRQIGVAVPRTTDQQWRHARRPDRRHLLPGDLLFFALGGRKDRHVGIYEGDGRFIHAPSSGKRVSRASLDNPYWQDRLIGTRTFL